MEIRWKASPRWGHRFRLRTADTLRKSNLSKLSIVRLRSCAVVGGVYPWQAGLLCLPLTVPRAWRFRVYAGSLLAML